MTDRPRALSLRHRLLLVMTLGVFLPLAIVAVWLTRSARVSGEQMLRARLEASLGNAVRTVGHGWVGVRSHVLALAEHPEVRGALAEGRDVVSDGGAEGDGAGEAWTALPEAVERVVFRDAAGRWRGSVPAGGPGAPRAAVAATIPLRMTVHDQDGSPVGSLDIHVFAGSLLPGSLLWPGVGGSIAVLFDAEGGAPLLPVPLDAGLLARDRFSWGGEDWLVARHRLHEPPLVIALAAPTGPFTEPLSRAARRGAAAFAVLLLAVFVLASWLTRRVTRPIERLAAAADAVAGGRLEQRVAEDGPAEIRSLAGAFNAMTESLRTILGELSRREAVAAVGEFATTLAHEVRNPLTSVRLDLERALEGTGDARARELVERALGEVARLDAVVTGSLRIARSGSLALEPLDVRAPLEAAAHAAEPLFAERRATLAPTTQLPSLPVRGDAGALEQLFLNLLRNAAEALPEGGRAWVQVETSPQRFRISVHDDGPGIRSEDLGRVLEPFYSTKADGTGLGLAVARRIAHAHGGDLVIDSTPGQGTAVHVLLPAAERAPTRNGSSANRDAS